MAHPEKPTFSLRLRMRSAGGSSQHSEPQQEQVEDISWRQKLKKNNPKQYDAVRKHDAAAARLRRLDQQIELSKPENAEKLKEKRAKKAEYMKAFREKKKLEKLQEEKKNEERRRKGETVPKKRKTRAETERESARKAKDAERQRIKRAKLSDKQRKAINKARCERERQK